ncbi:phosphatidylglycerol lysyltransferase domain-containing protein, partial [Salmonella enterica]|uniref:phosphatidylglycerol lysyltransferase domain-containing protein n=1 Tax=Salmonella enterica TaxID=28901 RepID=UPI0039EA3B72
RFIRVPGELADFWRRDFGERAEFIEARDHFDYVYGVQDLVELKGNKFHKKKNLLNQFKKKCDFEYHPMDMDCVEDVLEMQQEWYDWRE